jgi:hypothetical protein
MELGKHDDATNLMSLVQLAWCLEQACLCKHLCQAGRMQLRAEAEEGRVARLECSVSVNSSLHLWDGDSMHKGEVLPTS